MATPTAAKRNALFSALLAGDEPRACELLQSGAAPQLRHRGPAGFTSLHAAVVGGCAGALLALVRQVRRWAHAWTLVVNVWC